MNIPVLIVSAFLAAFQVVQADENYTSIDLTPVANFKVNAVKKYRTGHVRFRGVPFELPASRAAFHTETILAPGPTAIEVPVSVRRPTAVYILLSGEYVKREFKGQPVGEIILKFAGDKELTYPVIAWQTIRETWSYNTEILQPDGQGNPKLENVYAEPQNRGKPATAFLDMYVIELERGTAGEELTSIIFRDTSKETVKDIAPSFLVTGITVKHE